MDPLHIDFLPEGLRRPIFLLAFAGWNDAAESAMLALRFLKQQWGGKRFASLDPEEFYHFGLTRPFVRFKAGSETEREITWPQNEFFVCQDEGLSRDVVVFLGIEPHLKWRAYCTTIFEVARRLEVTLVLTLGALLAEVPHTRPIRMTGLAYDAELAARLGIRPSRYEGPTGIIGVFVTRCREAGIPTASLWANVPHYVSGTENYKAALALVRRVLTLLDDDQDLRELEEAAEGYDKQLNAIVKQNPKIAAYVRKLEAQDKDSAEPTPQEPSDLPPAADLVAEIERFLRQQPRGESRGEE